MGLPCEDWCAPFSLLTPRHYTPSLSHALAVTRPHCHAPMSRPPCWPLTRRACLPRRQTWRPLWATEDDWASAREQPYLPPLCAHEGHRPPRLGQGGARGPRWGSAASPGTDGGPPGHLLGWLCPRTGCPEGQEDTCPARAHGGPSSSVPASPALSGQLQRAPEASEGHS